MAVDVGDNIYVAVQHCCVAGGNDLGLLQKYSPAGDLLSSFGSLDVAGSVDTPRGLTLDADGNTVLIEDGGGFTIQTRDSAGNVIDTFFDGSVNSVSVAVDPNGDYLVGVSAPPGRVLRRSPSGTVLQVIGEDDFLSGSVFGVAVDPTSGRIYASDSAGADQVLVFDSAGTFISVFATGIGQPLGLAVDANGNVYVAQTIGGNQIHVFAPDGSLIESFGSGDLAGPGGGIAIDSQGRVIVGDFDSVKIFSGLAQP